MKIAHMTFSLPNAGKENMLVDIADEQNKCKHEVAIIVINKCFAESIRNRISNSIKILELNRKRSSKSIIPLIRLLLFLKFKFKADIIHVHDPEIGRILRFFGISNMVLTVHNTAMEIESIKNYKKIFAISKSVAVDLKSRGNINCKVIYNGIKPELIREKEA